MGEQGTIDRVCAQLEEANMDGRLRLHADELAEHYGVGRLDAMRRRDGDRATEGNARASNDAASGSSSNAGQPGCNEVAR